MRNKPIYATLMLMCLGTMLIVLHGCGGDDSTGAPEEMLPDDPSASISTGGLHGQVAQIDGVEITVRLLQDGKIIATTQPDASGDYQFDGIEPGAYSVQISAEGYEDTTLPAQILADRIASLDGVVLKALEMPVSHLRGVLSDQATKQTLKNVRVQLIDDKNNVRQTQTTATGGFAFENLAPGQKFTLVVEHDGYEPLETEIDSIGAGDTAKVEVVLVPIERDALPVGDGLTIGTKAPNFSLPDEDGNIHSLADYAGQRVVLVFDRGRW